MFGFNITDNFYIVNKHTGWGTECHTDVPTVRVNVVVCGNSIDGIKSQNWP
jgi:hypothetical protein